MPMLIYSILFNATKLQKNPDVQKIVLILTDVFLGLTI